MALLEKSEIYQDPTSIMIGIYDDSHFRSDTFKVSRTLTTISEKAALAEAGPNPTLLSRMRHASHSGLDALNRKLNQIPPTSDSQPTTAFKLASIPCHRSPDFQRNRQFLNAGNSSCRKSRHNSCLHVNRLD